VLYCGAATRDNTLWRTTHVAATRGALHIVSMLDMPRMDLAS
jgi:hypothetical protein